MNPEYEVVISYLYSVKLSTATECPFNDFLKTHLFAVPSTLAPTYYIQKSWCPVLLKQSTVRCQIWHSDGWTDRNIPQQR